MVKQQTDATTRALEHDAASSIFDSWPHFCLHVHARPPPRAQVNAGYVRAAPPLDTVG